jgi:hypothetical protein
MSADATLPDGIAMAAGAKACPTKATAKVRTTINVDSRSHAVRTM